VRQEAQAFLVLSTEFKSHEKSLGITKVQDKSSRRYLSKEMLFLSSKFPLNKGIFEMKERMQSLNKISVGKPLLM